MSPRKNANPAGHGGAHGISQIDAAPITRSQRTEQSNPTRSPRFISPRVGERVSERVGPSPIVRDIAVTLYAELVMCPHVLETFERIHNRHPSLPFRDVVLAMRLIALFESEAEGRA